MCDTMELWEQYDQLCLTGCGTEEQRAAVMEKLKYTPGDPWKIAEDAAGQKMKLLERLSRGEKVDLLLESEQLQQLSAPDALLWKWMAFMDGAPSEEALQQLERELENAGNDPLNRAMQQACREWREEVRIGRQRRGEELDDTVNRAQEASDKATADREHYQRYRR